VWQDDRLPSQNGWMCPRLRLAVTAFNGASGVYGRRENTPMQTALVYDSDVEKEKADQFLRDMRKYLSETISAQEVAQWIKAGQQVNEGLFLDRFVLHHIADFLRGRLSLDQDFARKAFLTESQLMRDQHLSGPKSPASKKKYLFTKAWSDPAHTVKAWWEPNHMKGQTAQSCPDWAFREPCPSVVFEAKLFRSGAIDHARTELVNGIYQCFYYRAHPKTGETSTHPAWDYDYACLFVYDASEKHSVVTAWKTINENVRKACWDSANVFVMVLPD